MSFTELSEQEIIRRNSFNEFLRIISCSLNSVKQLKI